MFTSAFWKDALERAIKTAAQTVLVFVGLDGGGLLTLNWTVAGAAIGGSVIASFATSAVSGATPAGQITPNYRSGAKKDGNPNTDA